MIAFEKKSFQAKKFHVTMKEFVVKKCPKFMLY